MKWEMVIISLLEKVVGFFSLLYGLAVAAVFVFPGVNWQSAFSDVLNNHPWLSAVYCAAFIYGGASILIGGRLDKEPLITTGLFTLSVARIFQVFSLWALFGFLSPMWLTTALLTLVTSILWLGRRVKPPDNTS